MVTRKLNWLDRWSESTGFINTSSSNGAANFARMICLWKFFEKDLS